MLMTFEVLFIFIPYISSFCSPVSKKGAPASLTSVTTAISLKNLTIGRHTLFSLNWIMM